MSAVQSWPARTWYCSSLAQELQRLRRSNGCTVDLGKPLFWLIQWLRAGKFDLRCRSLVCSVSSFEPQLLRVISSLNKVTVRLSILLGSMELSGASRAIIFVVMPSIKVVEGVGYYRTSGCQLWATVWYLWRGSICFVSIGFTRSTVIDLIFGSSPAWIGGGVWALSALASDLAQYGGGNELFWWSCGVCLVWARGLLCCSNQWK